MEYTIESHIYPRDVLIRTSTFKNCFLQPYGYQRGKGRREGEIRCVGLVDTNYYTQNKQQGFTVYHRESDPISYSNV